ncbi:serine/threonine-protein kinase [Leptolyngbya sp. PCC 6406]|uniref:serine/threonine-protein kinase n=1 Tax=Leptolyngbya sp. PCC 6406 TaxID=1173264 RepID=UPI0002ABEFF7|nr:serine/threonine-protein kinase [Leptolyngbya sp. PCC 6406]
MQPPLPLGTVLQNRYRVIKLLGQGGFGRTYLAEDQGRFDEQCAIKEFVPRQGEDHFSSKATELFQREAAILYQIQHPQIPQFRATFEIEQRLFLVQDYVDGTTYRDLLNERRPQGISFSESEVREFLRQMLPLLAHIHAKGIIHRDISPDNVMLRNSDRLPVLIDFGVVKEVVTRIQLTETTVPATTVGKVGYAPSEQMQSGRAYPNSDLYALAVTAVVLLTGREPQDLFDDVNLTWHWQRYANVSPDLAQVINKALSYRPGDRFQSVSEMAQALGGAPLGPIATSPAAFPATPVPPSSQMRTMAVGRPYQPTTGVAPGARPTHAAPPPMVAEDSSVWENPWAVAAMGVGLAVVAGIGGWGVVNALNQSEPNTTPPSPTLTLEPETTSPTPDPSPTPTTPAEPVEYSQQLNLRGGESTEVEGSLRANETVNYRFQGQQGQTLRAQLAGEGVLLTVLAPNGNPVDGQASRVLGWTGPLEFTGEYVVQLKPVEGLTQSNYALTVALEDPAPEPEEPTPGPPESPPESAPSISEQQVSIPQGEESLLVSNRVGSGRIQRYVINIQEGQTLTVNVEDASGPVLFAINQPSGTLIPDAERIRFWQGKVPLGGAYAIDVSAPRDAEFTLRLGVRN